MLKIFAVFYNLLSTDESLCVCVRCIPPKRLKEFLPDQFEFGEIEFPISPDKIESYRNFWLEIVQKSEY